MKNLILLFVVTIFTTNLYSQYYATVPNKKWVYDTITNDGYYLDYGYKRVLIDEDANTPGVELMLYTKHHNIGVTLSMGGVILSGVGGYMYSNSTYYTTNSIGMPLKMTHKPKYNTGVTGIIIGGTLSLIGFVYLIEAPVHIKRAAILLNENGVGVKIKL